MREDELEVGEEVWTFHVRYLDLDVDGGHNIDPVDINDPETWRLVERERRTWVVAVDKRMNYYSDRLYWTQGIMATQNDEDGKPTELEFIECGPYLREQLFTRKDLQAILLEQEETPTPEKILTTHLKILANPGKYSAFDAPINEKSRAILQRIIDLNLPQPL